MSVRLSSVCFSAFLALCPCKTSSFSLTGVDEEYFMECFRVFDRGCNGLISAAELRHVLSSLGDKMTDEEVDSLLVGFEDNQGQVYYEDFVRTVISE